MAWHPLNLALRFALELAALAAVGYWGWTEHEGGWRIIWAAGLVLLMAAAWGTFRVNGDPGDAPVPVSGIVRLLLEATVFGTAVILLADAGQTRPAIVLLVLVLVHYMTATNRIAWLLKQP